jgi:hypothetical protein
MITQACLRAAGKMEEAGSFAGPTPAGEMFPRGCRILQGGDSPDRGIQRCSIIFPGPPALGDPEVRRVDFQCSQLGFQKIDAKTNYCTPDRLRTGTPSALQSNFQFLIGQRIIGLLNLLQ